MLCFTTFIFAQQTGARYLIISHDNFYDQVVPLAEWKHKKGMRTKLVRLSEIGSSQTQIRDYISDAYFNWDIPPEFVLFVGAPNFIPFPFVSNVHSDNYYANVEGDIYNDILPGRLTVHSTSEAQNAVNKILAYERYPHLEDSLWFRKACLIARLGYDQDDSIYWSDVHHAASHMVNHGYVEIDTLSQIYGDNRDSVIHKVDRGRGFILYRGVGTNNWYNPFDCSPDLCQNGSMMPIVVSTTCLTLGSGSTPAAAERWFLTGNPPVLRGAAGYFATSTTSYAQMRSAVAKGFFDATFANHVRTFGEACEGGRANVYRMYPTQSGLREYLGFTTVGDPDMNLWTDTPHPCSVYHPPNIPIGVANFIVNVQDMAAHDPAEDAMVCIMGQMDTTLYAVEYTDANGDAYFTLSPQIVLDTLFVTVTGRNLLPYEGWMFVRNASGCWMSYLKSSVYDTLGGNNDGVINPGEDINMPLWVMNYGDSAGHEINGVLRTSDSYITITDSIKSFGDVTPQDSAYTGGNGYLFSIADTCPDRHIINFELTCRDSLDSTWVSYFFRTVRAADLHFKDIIITGGNGNQYVEPGETLTVFVALKNEGSTGIDSVTATLRSDSSCVTVLDSLGLYLHLGPDSIAMNDSNPFVFCADTGLAPGTLVSFQLFLHGGYYTGTVTFSLYIGQLDYYIWNPDPTGTPGVNCHSLLTSLHYHGNYGTTLAADLGVYRALLIFVGVWPNNHVIGSGSIEAQAIVSFLQNQDGRAYLEGGDVWYYDPLTQGGYDFSGLFGVNATADGSSNMGPVTGQTGTFTEGMYFVYNGENNFMDHISPSGGFRIFRDQNDGYDCGVAYDAGSYRTVGTSFELGLLNDGTSPSTREALLDSIMKFFGLQPGIHEQEIVGEMEKISCQVFPNIVRQSLKLQFFTLGPRDVVIRLFDVSGRVVATLYDNKTEAGRHDIAYNIKNLSAGIYFVRLESTDYIQTEKVIFIR